MVFNNKRRARRNYNEALQTLNLMAWGMGDWDEADGPTRDRIMKDVSCALKANGMRVAGSRVDGRGLFKLCQNLSRHGHCVIMLGTFGECCKHSLQLIEPHNYPTR